MDKSAEIEAVKKSIVNFKVQLDKIKSTMDLVEHEIDLLSTRYAQLYESYLHMKNEKTVVLASEYNDVKEEMTVTKDRLESSRIDRDNIRAAYANVENEIFSLKNKILDILDEYDNVVYGPFGYGYDG